MNVWNSFSYTASIYKTIISYGFKSFFICCFLCVCTSNVYAIPGTTATQYLPYPNDVVKDIVKSTDGTVYIGGEFTYFGGDSGHGLVLDRDTGIVTGSTPEIDYDVYASVSDGAGGWFIGGLFSDIGGTSINSLAHLKADGTLDTTWMPEPDDAVRSLALSGNILYVGGDFLNINGQARNRIAAIDVSSTASVNLTSWNPNLSCNPPYCGVFSIVVDGSTVYVGGMFATIGGQSRKSIAALDATTANASSWNPNPGPNPAIYAISVYVENDSSRTIYVGGTFATFAGGTISRPYLAAIDATTGIPDAFDPQVDGTVEAVVRNGNYVYVGGGFNTVGGQYRYNLAEVAASDGGVTSWIPNPVGGQDAVNSLLLYNNTLFVGGVFSKIEYVLNQVNSGIPRSNLVAFDLTDHSYIGDFQHIYDGTARNYIAAVDATTGVPNSFNPDMDQEVWTVKVHPSTHLVFAGGPFNNIQCAVATCISRNNLAVFNSSGTLQTQFPNDADGLVRSIAFIGSTAYIAGDFGGGFDCVGAGTVGGLVRCKLAALDVNTGATTSWNPTGGQTMGGFPDVIQPSYNNTLLYVGGDFDNVGGTSRTYLAAINASTGALTSWAPTPDTPYGEVHTISQTSDGALVYVGGEFNSINGTERRFVAALDAATGQPNSWDVGVDNLQRRHRHRLLHPPLHRQ